jgi:hypothetical protein
VDRLEVSFRCNLRYESVKLGFLKRKLRYLELAQDKEQFQWSLQSTQLVIKHMKTGLEVVLGVLGIMIKTTLICNLNQMQPFLNQTIVQGQVDTLIACQNKLRAGTNINKHLFLKENSPQKSRLFKTLLTESLDQSLRILPRGQKWELKLKVESDHSKQRT